LKNQGKLTITLDLRQVHGSKAATREITKVARAINATASYGFQLQDWNGRTIKDRFHNEVGTIDIA